MARHARSARLARVDLPDFGVGHLEPEIPAELYAARLARLRERMVEGRIDRLVVYADREHSANVSYLTGFDPRFEEALLIVGVDGEPAILVGNENWGTAGAAPLPMRRHRFQDFSLPSQPRDRSRPLREIFGEEGIRRGTRVGVVGWKTYAEPWMSDLPAYLVDSLRELVRADHVRNETSILIDPADGLRVINEPQQLAYLEWASTHVSEGVKSLLRGVRPGATEHDAVSLLGWNGAPLSCHVMLTAGPRARFGLLSPSDRPMAKGDAFTTAYGVWGALTCRAGFLVAKKSRLPSGVRDYVDRLVAPYFGAVVEWLEALHVGQSGGALNEIIVRRLADPFFGIFLNPGHQIHLDEWVNSPIWPGSPVELRSGMTLQLDIIPATGTDYFTTNIEDGYALADESLRAELASSHPGMWARTQARRAFMAKSLGIKLHADVLPLSNLAGFLPPFILDQSRAMVGA